jgi:hypothetical protein
VVSFQQATIKIEKEKEFDELRGAIERAFRADGVERLLKRIRSKRTRIRDVEKILSERLLEQVDERLAKSGSSAQQLYEALTLSDQAQLREFYLSKIEELDPALRAKFHKLYQYY